MMAENISINIQLTDNSREVLAAVPKAIARALWACGSQAADDAAGRAPVDTGLLKNSITFAVGGGQANKTAYHADKPDKSGVTRSGRYSGSVPAGNYVLIGSNVEYAASQELGNSRGIRPKHFLKDAVANGKGRIKELIIESFKNA